LGRRADPCFTMSLRNQNPVPIKERQAAANLYLSIDRYPALAGWWSQTGSNRRPDACKAPALPTELWPLKGEPSRELVGLIRGLCGMVGLDRLELSTLRLSGVRSNHLSYRPPKPHKELGAGSRAAMRHPGLAIASPTSLRPPYGIPPAGDEWKEKRRRRRSAPI
jgi:hypothetical protein